MTQDKLLAELHGLITKSGGSGKAKTRGEWEEAWGISLHGAIRLIRAGLKAGLMRHVKVPRLQINGATRTTDAYEVVEKKTPKRSTKNR
jgi:hypothetical protein